MPLQLLKKRWRILEWTSKKEDLNRIGVIYGVGIGGIHTFEEEVANYTLNKDTVGPKFNPFFIPKMIADIASGQISIMYGFHGPNFTTNFCLCIFIKCYCRCI